MEYQLNVIWPIDGFTADTRATRLWPGSHRDDAVDPFEIEPVVANMAPGSALRFLGSILPGAGANRSGAGPRAVIVGHCPATVRTSASQDVANPPEVARDGQRVVWGKQE